MGRPPTLGMAGARFTVGKTPHVHPLQESVSDSRRGAEKITISRAIGDRRRTLTKTRDRTGREETEDNIYNLDEAELRSFDEEFRRRAGAARRLAPPSFRSRLTDGPDRFMGGGHREPPHDRRLTRGAPAPRAAQRIDDRMLESRRSAATGVSPGGSRRSACEAIMSAQRAKR